VDPATTLLGAVAAFVASVAFLIRAAHPYASALGRAAVADRAALVEVRAERDALRRRVQLLEDRINAES